MRIPLATYRIQFTPQFGFRQAEAILPYLARLGISDLYASPLFRPRQGSTHGYDLVDPNAINPELGSPREFHSLVGKIRHLDMGMLLDIVPGHMAYDAQNPYLADVLENGTASRYSRYFDIDWNHYYETIRGKVLAPFLASYYGEALENGEIRLNYGEAGFYVSYSTLSFPLKVDTYLDILGEIVAEVESGLGQEHGDHVQLLGVLYVLKTFDAHAENGARRHQARFVKQNLWALYQGNPVIATAIDAVVALFNGRAGEPESFNRLESLLERQNFRFSFWKVACEEINYRRFFSINDLIALHMEDGEVFEQTHALLLNLLREGHITGLRIDHVDGLYDPAAYLRRLRGKSPETFTVVEKILADGEPLPPWPVEGTTGYDFLNALNGLFCAGAAEKMLTECYQRFTGRREACTELIYLNKKLIIERHLFGDVNNLAHLLKTIANRYRYGSDITMDSLKRALIEILACFPVYRTYRDALGLRAFDRETIATALTLATIRSPSYRIELDFIGRVLLAGEAELLSDEEKRQWLHFAMRFQQLTGPLMAKGYEDTFFYGYNRLLALNEVGGDPARVGWSPAAFHQFNLERLQRMPHSLNATATHDCKRGEDLRARLDVLSELPQEWARQVRQWSRLNSGRKRPVAAGRAPDRNDEYFFYQTLVGAWPCSGEELRHFPQRLKAYLIKAVREAKVHTTWLEPDTAYEDAYLRFVDQVLTTRRGNRFAEKFAAFQRRVAHFGRLNSLAQTLIKITAPGVPDFYQGCEFWDLNLVDPDNRRAVDFARRIQVLDEIAAGEQADLPALIADLLSDMSDGRIKLFLIRRALAARRRHARLFQQGDYLPLPLTGTQRERVIAFARRQGDAVALTIAPRLLAGWLGDGELPLGLDIWKDTAVELPGAAATPWENALTGECLAPSASMAVGAALRTFPVGLFVQRANGDNMAGSG